MEIRPSVEIGSERETSTVQCEGEATKSVTE